MAEQQGEGGALVRKTNESEEHSEKGVAQQVRSSQEKTQRDPIVDQDTIEEAEDRPIVALLFNKALGRAFAAHHRHPRANEEEKEPESSEGQSLSVAHRDKGTGRLEE